MFFRKRKGFQKNDPRNERIPNKQQCGLGGKTKLIVTTKEINNLVQLVVV